MIDAIYKLLEWFRLHGLPFAGVEMTLSFPTQAALNKFNRTLVRYELEPLRHCPDLNPPEGLMLFGMLIHREVKEDDDE